MQKCFGTICLSLLAMFLGAAIWQGRKVNLLAQPKSEKLRIGVSDAMFRDVPENSRKSVVALLENLMADQAGISCQSQFLDDPAAIGKRLKSGKLDLGFVNGFEYAWIHKKYPGLQRLALCLVGERSRYTACLVTHQDSPLRGFDDLKGELLHLPSKSRPHVHLYLERRGNKKAGYSFKICRKLSIGATLDDIVRGKAAATVVDGAALDSYKLLKPGCFKKLKIVDKSSLFPASVILFAKNGLPKKLEKRLRTRLLSAHERTYNRILMNLFRISSFAPVPKEYMQWVREVYKSYGPMDR